MSARPISKQLFIVVFACALIALIVLLSPGGYGPGSFVYSGLLSLKRRMAKALPEMEEYTMGGSYASSDRFLNHLQIDNPSERLKSTASGLAPDETLLFVGPLNDPAFTQTFLTVSYLSWPKQIAVLGCEGSGHAPRVLYQPQAGFKIRRAIFYLRHPPETAARTAQQLSPNITLIEVSEKTDWTSFCSQ